MIKNIIYVEDGSVDLDELKSTVTNETKIIVYRQGSNPPTLVRPQFPINDKVKEEK
jgi:selenocysteine lyase/cysteine desulfurase